MRSAAAIASLAAASFGLGARAFIEDLGGGHYPRPELTYTHTPKPLSKRAKRRLRGKGLA